ncbi:response regulator [Pseudocolwellia sp. AS88]|uniref:response regulator n=1 Tax=Pseudocolwellia sp. AS88 TaxID=3063958 RepID=UPI0026EED15F|nr:response regulator [Pseudocolwellia sp. AS88]MDO7086506.1 response regulator [Pseudocolwellia sp. AS88]
MFFRRLRNNLSIRKKVWGLVLLPAIVIIGISGRQVLEVNDQLTSLEKATHLVDVISQLKNLNNAAHELHFSDNNSSNKFTLQQKELSKLAIITEQNTEIFSEYEVQQFQKLIEQYKETIHAIENAEDKESKHDAIQWQISIYKELLLTIEKTHFKAPMEVVDSNLKALLQLEWLSFWVQDEIWQSEIILGHEHKDLTELVRDEIRALIQNQQLFVDRFLAINADKSQTKLLLSVFSNIAFEQSNTFREQLLDNNLITQITPQALEQGTKAFSQRLSLFQNVAKAINEQLQQNIQTSVSTFEQYRIIFFSITAVSILVLLLFGAKLAQRITSNLNTVLDFLDHKGDHERELKLHIEGNDELSKFAVEVERLAIEHQQNQRDLIASKNDAVEAKEIAIKASKAKSSFLANMSHEIRTPLNGVIGISEILASTNLSATQKDYVDTIEISSQLLLSLINDILDFSKIESGKLPISAYSTCLRESVYDIAAIVTPKIKEKAISLQINIDQNLPLRVMADDHRIRQVLMNLMSNAVKFTEKGCITIGITCEKKGDDTSCLFEVTDTGIGIDEAQRKNIFEPFSQEDNSTTRQFGGTGLGLAISTQLIELMGGKLALDSEKGKGSRFYFSLPLDVPQQNIEKYTLLDETQIILVCDDSVITKTMMQQLEFLGLTITDYKLSLESAPNQSESTSQIIVYAITPKQYEYLDLAKLQIYNRGNSAVCLVSPLNVKPLDFQQSISALLTFPLLGNRLKKALERSHKRVISQHSEESNTEQDTSMDHRILLVDDNKINQKIASLHIKALGYKFDIANDGEEAVEMFKSGEYDLVLMDCMMPIKDGFTATKEIREFETTEDKTRSIIIALTASVIEGDIKNCFLAGMDDYLPKPFKPEMLKSRIINALSVKNKKEKKSIQVEDNKESEAPTSAIKVLIVEDNRINQKVASLILKQKNYQFMLANDGQEAIDIYTQDQSFDIILMDLMMPIKDGFEASEEIRSYEKSHNLPATPIIAVTASVVNDDIDQCFKIGMNAFIPKPIQSEKLYNEINNCLNLKS